MVPPAKLPCRAIEVRVQSRSRREDDDYKIIDGVRIDSETWLEVGGSVVWCGVGVGLHSF